MTQTRGPVISVMLAVADTPESVPAIVSVALVVEYAGQGVLPTAQHPLHPTGRIGDIFR